MRKIIFHEFVHTTNFFRLKLKVKKLLFIKYWWEGQHELQFNRVGRKFLSQFSFLHFARSDFYIF